MKFHIAAGTVIDGTGNFVTGESGSSAHFGPGATQFQAGVSGYIGSEFEAPGEETHYLWLSLMWTTWARARSLAGHSMTWRAKDCGQGNSRWCRNLERHVSVWGFSG